MSDLKQCPNCKNIQTRDGRFCSQCGFDLSKVPGMSLFTPSAPVSASISHSPSHDYGTLRFISSLFIFIGWVVVIITIVSSCIMFASAAGVNAIVSQGSSGIEKVIGAVGSTVTLLASFFYSVFGIVFGLSQIAAGQIIMVLLDIRDDVRGFVLKQKNT